MMDVFLKGIGVGFAVAAPVGPIGLLCIKRTLQNGRMAGLCSGLGAATADAIYGVMVAAGFAATGVLVAHAGAMQMFGGGLIVVLGLLSVRTFVSGAQRDAADVAHRTGLLAAFGSTFVLTLSNPMTILAFVGLVAGLSASSSTNVGGAFVLVAGVFLGSLLWWVLLVTGAAQARSYATGATLRWLDLVSGLVLTVWGAWIVWGAV